MENRHISEYNKPTTMTNTTVGQMIGLTHSGVSRLRNGERGPSITTISRVHSAFGWSVEDQIHSINNGTYAADFEARINMKFDNDETAAQ